MYILEQIESIRVQSLQPHEVIVCDDCSEDDTCDIVQRFIDEYKLNHWKLYRNEVNLGWKNNFYSAILKSTGDIIFLADQDDVWKDSKLSKMENCFSENSDIKVLSCRHDIIDAEGKYVRLWRTTTGECRKLSYNEVYRKKPLICKGCTMAFSSEIRNMLLLHGLSKSTHDGAIFYYGLITQSCYLLDEVGVYYRIHGHQTVGESSIKYSEIQSIRKDGAKEIDFLDCLEEVKNLAETHYSYNLQFQDSIANHIESMRCRVTALKNKSIKTYLKGICKTLRCVPVNSIIADVVYITNTQKYFVKTFGIIKTIRGKVRSFSRII